MMVRKAVDTSSSTRAIANLRQISFGFCIYDSRNSYIGRKFEYTNFEIRMSSANSII